MPLDGCLLLAMPAGALGVNGFIGCVNAVTRLDRGVHARCVARSDRMSHPNDPRRTDHACPRRPGPCTTT